MKKDQKEYEFQKLNTAFYTDHYSLDSKKRRNRLWTWFDRVTRYSLIPKIIVAMTLVTVAGAVVGYKTNLIENHPVVAFVVAILLFCEGMFFLSLFLDIPYNYNSDVVLNPAFRRWKGNAWHKREINQS